MKGIFLASMCALVLPLSAQTEEPQAGPPPPPRPFVEAGAMRHMGPIGPMWMAYGKVVTGAPYSADVNSSSAQTLADGNTISRRSTGHVARDSQGRTYFQQNISGGPWAQKGSMTITFVSDPVTGYAYVLNPNTKIAIRRPLRSRTGEHAPVPPEGMARPDAKDRVETDLGQQVINGLSAVGKSIVHTIPAGSIGNSQPIVEKSEVWTSSDLQVVVLSKHTDPRSGQSTYTLNNIQRGEPNPSLFQVPSDYTVKDAPAFPGHPR